MGRRRGCLLRASLVVVLLLLPGRSALAEDDHVLARLLRDADSFRVRARAALALGHTGDERALGPLESALLDPHAAVRAAAASALGEIGTRRSVGPLRRAAGDASTLVAAQAKQALRRIAARETIGRAVPEAVAAPSRPPPALDSVRYAVVLGDMRNRTELAGDDVAVLLGERIDQELRKLDYVAVFSLAEMTESVAHELARRKLPTFRIEGNLNRVESDLGADQYRVRCEVSLLLMDEPERTLRSMMKGAATSTEQPRGERASQHGLLARKTVKSAVRSAMGNALQAIEAAAVRRDLGMGDIRAEASLAADPPPKARRGRR